MRLSSFSDYSLRVLMYSAVKKGDLATTAEVSEYFRISYNHLVKVVHRLSSKGFLEVHKGKGGGFRLAKDSSQITIASVLRAVEPDFFLVECHNSDANRCVITPFCRLKRELDAAFGDFISRLERVTVADMIRDNQTKWHRAG
jgi:Rrf2 family nitric oxide-sensitive transcriptional repressor